MVRIIGYTRVSTENQNLDIQRQAIENYALAQKLDYIIYEEKISSRKKERPELHHALKAAARGDRFIVYKLDRLARSTKELYEITEKLKERGIDFVSINDSFDTSTPAGKAMFGMLAVFAEFERDIIHQRTKAGLEAARKRGKFGGRPAIEESKKRQIRKLFESGESAADIAKEFKIGRSTVYKILKSG